MLKSRRRRFWRDAEIGFAIQARFDGLSNEEIGIELDREGQAVTMFFQRYRNVISTGKTLEQWRADLRALPRPSVIDPRTLAERDRRVAAGPRDLTAAICGDPGLGRSALERRS